MPIIDRILVGLGFGVWTETILKTAASLAKLHDASLTVIHSNHFEPPVYMYGARVQRDLEEQRTNARRHLDDTVAKVLGGDAGYETRLVERRPVEGIVRTAREIDADLIVLGAQRRAGLRRRLMGAVAEGVHTQTDIPVLTVRDHEGQDIPPFQRILVPTNFTEVARESAAYAADLAERYKASLTFMTSLEDADLADKDEDEIRNARAAVLAEWAAEFGVAGADPDTVLSTGRASEEILKTARKGNHDLIVIGAAHQPFLEATIFGTTSMRVIRHAHCSVLSIVKGME